MLYSLEQTHKTSSKKQCVRQKKKWKRKRMIWFAFSSIGKSKENFLSSQKELYNTHSHSIVILHTRSYTYKQTHQCFCNERKAKEEKLDQRMKITFYAHYGKYIRKNFSTL